MRRAGDNQNYDIKWNNVKQQKYSAPKSVSVEKGTEVG